MLYRVSLVLLSTLALASTGVAQTASVTPYGADCGLTATGSIEPNGNSRRVTLTVNGAPPRTTVLFMVSGATADIPLGLFGSNCSLLLDTVPFSQTHQTDTNGSYTFSKALGQIYPISSYVQFLSVDFDSNGNLVIATSNGLHVSYV